MHKHDLNERIEFDDRRFHPKILLSEPGYRMVLLSMRAGQSIPDDTAPGILTILAILGWITLFTESLPCELRAGQVVCIDTGAPHRLEAHEDSALLVLITGGTGVLRRTLRRPGLARDPAATTSSTRISTIRCAVCWKFVHSDERSRSCAVETADGNNAARTS